MIDRYVAVEVDRDRDRDIEIDIGIDLGKGSRILHILAQSTYYLLNECTSQLDLGLLCGVVLITTGWQVQVGVPQNHTLKTKGF